MRLEQLELENWCQHQRRLITFHPGLNAILGPNGAGKSNVLTAILFALSGDYSRNPGDKAENIYQHAAADAAASVKLTFTHGDARYAVRRVLRGGQSTLNVYDLAGKTLENIRGDTKVSKRMCELLGVPPDVLSTYVVVQQGQMFAPFDNTKKPAERAVAFQVLFGTARAEGLWDALGEYLATVPAMPSVDLAAYQQAVTSADQLVADYTQQLVPYGNALGWQRATDPDQALIARAQSGAVAQAWLQQLPTQARGTWQRWRAARQRWTAARATGAACAARITQLSDFEPAARETLRAFDNLQQTAARRDALTRQLAALQQRHRQTVEPIYPTHGMSEELVRQNISQLEREIAVDTATLARLTTDDVCPTCGQEVPDSVRTDRQMASQRHASNLRTLAEENGRLVEIRRYQREMHAFDRDTAAAIAEEEQVNRELAALPVAEISPEDVATAREILTAIETARVNMNVAQIDEQQSGTLVAQTRADMMMLNVRAKEVRRELASVPTAADVAAAHVRLEQQEQRARAAAMLQGSLTEATRQQRAAHTQYEGAAAAAATAARQSLIRNRATAARSELHRERFPRIITQRRLAELAPVMNETLQAFGARFRVLPDQENLSYTGRFIDGREQSILRLSGGEKMLASLAFRIGVNARFARELGMLCLDEPTDALDADNVRCLHVALDCLRRFSQTRGLQCILVTHESVGHLVDNVINLAYG